MMQEEKDLLFKDLCIRLPYHVRCKIWIKDGTTEEGPLDLEHNYADVLLNTFYYNDIKDIKPYLRPISSMTKEEFDKYEELEWAGDFENLSIPLLDWLNAHHFDYRGLIEKNLALDCTKENNPYKKIKL